MLVYPDTNFVTYAVYDQCGENPEVVPTRKAVYRSLTLLDAIIEYNKLS